MKLGFPLLIIFTLTACATIVNDSHIPLTVSFSDGSAGQCNFKNKRGTWSSEIPTTNILIRRSDDALNYNCSTEDGKEVSGSIRSEMEGAKMAASVVFLDLGITDAITDKHRTYQGNIVIPVNPQDGDFVSNTYSSGDSKDTNTDHVASISNRDDEESTQAKSYKPNGCNPVIISQCD